MPSACQKSVQPLSLSARAARSLLTSILFVFASAAFADAPPAFEQGPVTLPELPAAATDGPLASQIEISAMNLEEEIFLRRELFEEFAGEYQAEAAARIHRDEKVEMFGRLANGTSVSKTDVKKNQMERDRAVLGGVISGLNAQMVLKYEEINLIKLRVLTGEKVPSEELQKARLDVRGIAVEVAKKRIERAQVVYEFEKYQWNTVRLLTNRHVESREQLLDRMVDFARAEQQLNTEKRRLEVARLALELVRKRYGAN